MTPGRNPVSIASFSAARVIGDEYVQLNFACHTKKLQEYFNHSAGRSDSPS